MYPLGVDELNLGYPKTQIIFSYFEVEKILELKFHIEVIFFRKLSLRRPTKVALLA
jgi:hypothetical protein